MGKARAQQFSQTRTLHRRRRPRGARDRTRLRRRHAVLSHRRRTALPPPRQTPQTRRFSPTTQQQQLWQHLFASLVRTVWPRRSLAGACLADQAAEQADWLGRVPPGDAPAKQPAKAGRSARRRRSHLQLTRQPPAFRRPVRSRSIHTSHDLPRPDSVQTASRQRPDSVQTVSRQRPDSKIGASRQLFRQ